MVNNQVTGSVVLLFCFPEFTLLLFSLTHSSSLLSFQTKFRKTQTSNRLVKTLTVASGSRGKSTGCVADASRHANQLLSRKRIVVEADLLLKG
jgi:hypothetical protein